MTRKLFILIAACWTLLMPCQATQYTQKDSIKVMTLLAKAARQKPSTNWMIFFARELKGVPYVGKTLEVNSEEQLIVNLRELDCTTYVENVISLSLCMKTGKRSFQDYCTFLRQIRYRQGEVGYPTRLHYFTQWIADNTEMGFVSEIQKPNPPFTATQLLDIDFMSTHQSYYPMLTDHPQWTALIRAEEQKLTGREYQYIPKEEIRNSSLFRQTILDGDIIAITTKKKGLDTSHIGIAVWHKDGLHMLNASQVRKKVVEEPMTLYQYMQKHPSQQGIRIIRVK